RNWTIQTRSLRWSVGCAHALRMIRVPVKHWRMPYARPDTRTGLTTARELCALAQVRAFKCTTNSPVCRGPKYPRVSPPVLTVSPFPTLKHSGLEPGGKVCLMADEDAGPFFIDLMQEVAANAT